jgi:outer membrane immunogenic protein
MRNILAITAVAALASGGALAADLPTLPPPAVAAAPEAAPALHDWSGFYGGLNLGYSWGQFDLPRSGRGGDGQGVIGGAQAGVNFQWDNIVAGFETDIQGADVEGRNRRFGGTYALRSYIQPFGTARGRVGVAFDRVLAYATGGFAYANVENKLRIFNFKDTQSDLQIGWTTGAGLEYAFDDHWSVKAEYLYVDLADKKYRFDVRGETVRQKVGVDQHIARVGLNYRF